MTCRRYGKRGVRARKPWRKTSQGGDGWKLGRVGHGSGKRPRGSTADEALPLKHIKMKHESYIVHQQIIGVEKGQGSKDAPTVWRVENLEGWGGAYEKFESE